MRRAVQLGSATDAEQHLTRRQGNFPLEQITFVTGYKWHRISHHFFLGYY
jgi:hypothetical protein